MMTTDAHRRAAARIAAQREHRHEAAHHRRGWRPRKGSGAHYHYIGLLGEFLFAEEVGGRVDTAFRAGGDDGSDCTFQAGDRVVPVDVKVSTYTGPDPMLRVPVTRLHRDVLYVAGVYSGDSVTLVGWEWGAVVAAGCRRVFPPHDTVNVVVPYGDLRPLLQLRLVGSWPGMFRPPVGGGRCGVCGWHPVMGRNAACPSCGRTGRSNYGHPQVTVGLAARTRTESGYLMGSSAPTFHAPFTGAV